MLLQQSAISDLFSWDVYLKYSPEMIGSTTALITDLTLFRRGKGMARWGDYGQVVLYVLRDVKDDGINTNFLSLPKVLEI